MNDRISLRYNNPYYNITFYTLKETLILNVPIIKHAAVRLNNILLINTDKMEYTIMREEKKNMYFLVYDL